MGVRVGQLRHWDTFQRQYSTLLEVRSAARSAAPGCPHACAAASPQTLQRQFDFSYDPKEELERMRQYADTVRAPSPRAAIALGQR